jgi:hypothetical protein
MQFKQRIAGASLALFLPVLGILIENTYSSGVSAPQSNSVWGMNSIWDDGQAEVAKYQARQMVYGKSRSFESHYITVKEDFSPKYHVKADNAAPGTIPVLKLNIISAIPTENYDYRYLTSVFVSRTNPLKLIKLTAGSQEWCGNTFKELRNWETRPTFEFHSYFDGEGDGTMNPDLRPGDLWEDQLPVALRSLPFRSGYEFKTRVADSLVNNRAKVPQLCPAVISVEGPQNVGKWRAWKVEVKREGLVQTYWFEQSFPNTLVKFVSTDGRDLLLQETARRKYWLSQK